METDRHSGLLVFYDTDCGLCTRSVHWMMSQCRGEPVLFLPVTSEMAQALAPDRHPDEMAAVPQGGNAVYGGNAWIECLLAMPRYRWLGRLMSLFRPLVRWGYRQIARRRHQISKLLWGDQCQIP